MAPTYHDIYITTANIPRTSIFNLPYNLELSCTRVSGWQLWSRDQRPLPDHQGDKLIAGEYAGKKKWLAIDVGGHIILDSREGEG